MRFHHLSPALLLGLVACAPQAKPVTRLDCPARHGELNRVSVAADGRSCLYQTSHGAEVQLRLLPVAGGYAKTLASLEAELSPLVRSAAPVDALQAAAPGDATPEPSTAKRGTKITLSSEHGVKVERLDPAAVAAQAETDAEASGAAAGDADADGWPGRETTNVDLPGLHVHADDAGAKVQMGSVHINADEAGATVRTTSETRARGEGFSRERSGVRSTLILTSDRPGAPYHLAGYVAAGRKSGPLAVATVKLRDGVEHDELYHDARWLVRRNSGL